MELDAAAASRVALDTHTHQKVEPLGLGTWRLRFHSKEQKGCPQA